MAPFTGSHTRLLSALGLIAGVALLSILVPRFNLGVQVTTVNSPSVTTQPNPPTNSPTDPASTPMPPPTAIVLPTVTVIAVNTETVELTRTPLPTAIPMPTSLPATPTAAPQLSQPSTGDLRLAVVSTHYELAAMPSEGCGKVNSQRLGRRFDIRIAITNNTDQDLQAPAWGAAVYSDKKPAKLCYFEGKGTLPPLVAKHTVTLTLSAFVESEQEIDTLLVGTSTGKVARLCFSNSLAKLCNS